jgi:predicted permease
MAISIEGTLPPPSQMPIVTRLRAVGPEYFRGLQIPMLEGREFNDHDTSASLKVAVVSQSLAKLYWPGQEAIGKRLKPEMPGAEWCTVVGVAADVRHWTADVTDVEPTAYYAYTQLPESFLPLLEGSMSIAVRAKNSSSLLSSIQAAVGEVDKTVPVYQVQGMEQMVADAGSLRRFDMWLIGSFAGLALLLAAVGIYGVMAYSVSHRTREIGIRMALGASRKDVLLNVLHQGTSLVAAGVGLGIGLSLLATRALAQFLFETTPLDPAIFLAAALLLGATGVVACLVPGIRAAQLDPREALNTE